MKKFLLASRDESVAYSQPCIVHAENSDEALQKYLRLVRAKSDHLREWVLELTVNMSFAEQFYLESPQEHERFNKTAVAGTEIEIIKSRVRKFFSERPPIGERYIQYMETGNETLVDAEMLEFIAVRETVSEHSMIALDMNEFEVVE